jgi:hypothetical protein
MTSAPDERLFVVFPRGHVRDRVILDAFRNRLRAVSANPETGVPFTEDEIARATQPGSRFYIDADAIDLYGQATQSRALIFADQLDVRRANSTFLRELHGPAWLGPDSVLPATGATGLVNARATAGSVFVGSTTIPNPIAAVATDPNGFRYQVLVTAVTPASGSVLLLMRAIDGSSATNLRPGTILRWSQNQPLGAEPEASVATQFDGGFNQESDSAYADRIARRQRHRPASGNDAHFASWSEQASVAVERGFIYPIALNAGTVMVAVTEKRNLLVTPPQGPDARIASAGTLADATGFLVPPGSPVVPRPVFVIVVTPTPQQSDLVLRLGMPKAAAGGWFDAGPWPSYSAAFPEVKVTAVPTATSFTVEADAPLPGGLFAMSQPNVPAVMLWNREVSRWVRLDVAGLVKIGNNVTFALNSAPGLFDTVFAPRNIAIGDRLSPYTDRFGQIAFSLESYFDSLGPGELFTSIDPRFSRGVRFPSRLQEFPSTAGQAVIGVLLEDLGGIATNAELTSMSRTDPDLPFNVIDGPGLVTLGHASLFPL